MPLQLACSSVEMPVMPRSRHEPFQSRAAAAYDLGKKMIDSRRLEKVVVERDRSTGRVYAAEDLLVTEIHRPLAVKC